MKPAKITVFCSSANLGPGFDTLGLGLSIPLTCILDYPTQKTTISTDNNEITTDLKHNLISKTVQFVGNVYRKNLPFYELKIKSEIPLSRGLGSSASAIVLGILVASKILSLELSNQQITDLGTVIEGHPDNVSASVYGNLTVSFLTKPLPPFQEEWFEEGSRCEGVEELIGNLTRTTVVEVNKAIRVTAVIPDFELATSKARQVLPTLYPRSSLIHNLGRTTSLLYHLSASKLDIPLLQDCFGDVIHQPYRSTLIPGLEQVLELRGDGLLGICLSGAGPTVLLFHLGFECEVVKKVFEKFGVQSRVVEMGMSSGYLVEI